MAVKSFFSILKGDEFISVQGWQISLHFACQIEHGRGYRITHMPTGFLLTDMGFATVDAAKHVAEVCELVFANYLDRSDVRILNNAAKNDPACKELHEVIQSMNQLSKTKPTIGEDELSKLLEKFDGKS